MGVLAHLNQIRYSFIIPVKDQIQYTRDCLLSWFAYASGYQHESEILIVDDGSGEETKAFLAKLPPPIRVITNPENMGYAKSNNRATAEARGNYLILLNNDLVLQRGWFESMQIVAQSSSRKRIVGNVQISRVTGAVDHVGKFFDDEGDLRHFGQFYQNLFPWDPPVDFVEFPSVTAACWLIEKALFDSLGGFDEAYVNGFEDDDFCLRASKAGCQIGVALRSWVYHYVSTSSGRKDHEDKNRERFLNKWGQQALDWNRQHFEPTLRALKSWSCQQ